MDESTLFHIEHPKPGVLSLVGDLDVLTAPHLDAALESVDGVRVDIDLSSLVFVDSSGLRALVRAKRSHRGVRFVQPTPALARLVELTGLTDTLFRSDGGDEG